jgi:hypothetical protein
MATFREPQIKKVGPGTYQILVPEGYSGSIEAIEAAVLAMTMADLEQDLTNEDDSARMKRERKARYRPFKQG